MVFYTHNKKKDMESSSIFSTRVMMKEGGSSKKTTTPGVVEVIALMAGSQQSRFPYKYAVSCWACGGVDHRLLGFSAVIWNLTVFFSKGEIKTYLIIRVATISARPFPFQPCEF